MSFKKSALLGAAAYAFMSENSFAEPENRIDCSKKTEVTDVCNDVKNSVEKTKNPLLNKRTAELKKKMTELKYKPLEGSDGFIISTEYAENAFVIFPTADDKEKNNAYFINCYAHECPTQYFTDLNDAVGYIESVQKEAPYGFYLHSGNFPPDADENK